MWQVPQNRKYMEWYIIVIIVLAVLLVAALVGLFAVQASSGRERLRLTAAYEKEKDGLSERIAESEKENAALQSRLEAKEELERRRQEEQLRQREESQQEQLRQRQEMEERHRKDLEQMKLVFENMAARNNETFKARSAETISELLKPVQEKFAEFSAAVKDSQEKSIDRHSRLEQKIQELDSRSVAVGNEARNLANALTGYSKVQGDFGEMLLADVLKNAGLTEGIHFVTQNVITDESGREIRSEGGRTMIPDVMVNYPDDTVVIIDSKVSLKAYNDYMAADTVEQRAALAKAHVESVRSHVDELKTKAYASYIPDNKRKVDFNIMFIPVEGAFRLLLEQDPRLWQVAKDNNVLIVSQMTLVIVLNMIRMSWKQHEQEKNIADVYKTAEELMAQLRAWMESYVKIGESLEKASAAYEDSKRKLVDSNQSVIKKIGKLEKLGAAPRRSGGKIKSTTRLDGSQTIIPKELDSEQI